jgi:hypothetical protein
MKSVKKILAVLVICLIVLIPASIASPSTKYFTAEAATSKVSDNQSYDAFFMNQKVSFQKKFGDGIYWVPVNVLGKPKYTDEEILDMIDKKDPEYAAKMIDTLFDAIKYFYLSGFKVLRSDHKDLPFEGVIWQHHKNGSEALLTNEGDCSGTAALISYLLDGDYKETGYFSYNLDNGSGHVFNYFKNKNKYYFIDCTVIRYATMEKEQPVQQDDYMANLVMADSIEQYVAYYKMHQLNNASVIFNTYSADRVIPISFNNGKYYLPEDLNIKFYGDKKQIGINLVKRPVEVPGWNFISQIDRMDKAEVSILPYSYEVYQNGGQYYELRIYTLNDITVELKSLAINYYNSSDQMLLSHEYTEDEISIQNKSIFDMRAYPMQYGSQYAYITGVAEFKDIHGNIFNKKFKCQMK